MVLLELLNSFVNFLQIKRERLGLWWVEVFPTVTTVLAKAKCMIISVTTGRATNSWGE